MDQTNDTKTEQPVQSEQNSEKQIRLVDVDIADEVTALNVLVSFVNLAQQRGVFSFPESSKIWECIKKFQQNKQ
jgi:flagellin-like hook-associated protein FlgL